ncbi:hypothetical protein [Hymenobacter sp.]|uniref:hypothetical protein n=1 Tax=Hymenobacter sp. TaxID=1898978 RepID=UPI00286A646F|nr:hypothetical protein [Hymenobacter sp.]
MTLRKNSLALLLLLSGYGAGAQVTAPARKASTQKYPNTTGGDLASKFKTAVYQTFWSAEAVK